MLIVKTWILKTGSPGRRRGSMLVWGEGRSFWAYKALGFGLGSIPHPVVGTTRYYCRYTKVLLTLY